MAPLKDLQDLLSDYDVEGLIEQQGAPLNEYDDEAAKLLQRLKHLSFEKIKIDRSVILDALMGIWSESFDLNGAELEKRRANLTKLALEVEDLCVK